MLVGLVQLWQTSYVRMRLIDNAYFNERREPMELAIFQSECVKQLEASKKHLLTGWFPDCQRVFFVGNKRRLIPTMRDQVPALRRGLFLPRDAYATGLPW